MMVSAASPPSNAANASPVIANAATQSPAPTAPSTDGAPAAAAPASASAPTTASTAAAASTTQQTGAQTSAQPTAPDADVVPRFSDMLRAANDEDDGDGTGDVPVASSDAAPKPDAADTSKDDAHGDAAASIAIALAMWPGMAAPVTLVPSGVVPPAQPSATERPGRSASVTDADTVPAGEVPTGPAVPFSADTKAPEAAAVVGADANASAKRAIGFRPAMDDAAAPPDTGRVSARSTIVDSAAPADTASPRERVAANASLPNMSANTMPSAAGWSTPVDATAATDTQTTTLKLPPQSPGQWNQPLTEALGDRLSVQLGRGSEQAVIRLDPPMLGSIEISIRHEAGSLQVQLSASNGEVLRQLHGIGDTLRQDLSQRQTGDVSVVVSDSSRDANGADSQRGRGRQRDAQTADDGPGRALAEAETETANANANAAARAPFSFTRGRE
jgi:flagellar hook-length control protein FliK